MVRAAEEVRGERRPTSGRERDCEAKAAACGIALPIDGYVFSHEVDGSASWRPHYVSLAFGRSSKKLDVRLHDLRHFNATNLLAAGTDILTVSGRLGHADASTTLNIYAHFVKQTDEKAAGAIGAIPKGQLRVHLSDESDQRRRAILNGFARLDLLAVMFETPYDRKTDDQPARDRCMRELVASLPDLGVGVVVLDSRGPDRDKKDRSLIRSTLRNSGHQRVSYSHRGSRDEPLIAHLDR